MESEGRQMKQCWINFEKNVLLTVKSKIMEPSVLSKLIWCVTAVTVGPLAGLDFLKSVRFPPSSVSQASFSSLSPAIQVQLFQHTYSLTRQENKWGKNWTFFTAVSSASAINLPLTMTPVDGFSCNVTIRPGMFCTDCFFWNFFTPEEQNLDDVFPSVQCFTCDLKYNPAKRSKKVRSEGTVHSWYSVTVRDRPTVHHKESTIRRPVHGVIVGTHW